MNYYETQRSAGPHPVLIIGIFVFVLPFFNAMIPFNIPGWVKSIGLLLIFIGAGLSIFRR